MNTVEVSIQASIVSLQMYGKIPSRKWDHIKDNVCQIKAYIKIGSNKESISMYPIFTS